MTFLRTRSKYSRPENHVNREPRFREGDRVRLRNFPDLTGHVAALNTRKGDFRHSIFDYNSNQFITSIILDKGNYVITFESLLEWEEKTDEAASTH